MPFDARQPQPKLTALQRALRQMGEEAAERRAQSAADEAAARCPLAEKIIANNQPDTLDGGMMGAMMVVLSTQDPRTAKRKAAENILHLRKNRLVCKRQGRNYRKADAQLLRRARILRECAIEFATAVEG